MAEVATFNSAAKRWLQLHTGLGSNQLESSPFESDHFESNQLGLCDQPEVKRRGGVIGRRCEGDTEVEQQRKPDADGRACASDKPSRSAEEGDANGSFSKSDHERRNAKEWRCQGSHGGAWGARSDAGLSPGEIQQCAQVVADLWYESGFVRTE